MIYKMSRIAQQLFMHCLQKQSVAERQMCHKSEMTEVKLLLILNPGERINHNKGQTTPVYSLLIHTGNILGLSIFYVKVPVTHLREFNSSCDRTFRKEK